VINGQGARGSGRTASIASDALDIGITLTAGGAQTIAALDALTVSGGGATFNLGPSVNIVNQVRLGAENMAARNLGKSSLGFLDDLGSGKTYNIVDGDMDTAQKIVDEAINKVSQLRSRIGAFQSNVVQSTIRSLSIGLENTTGAESIIRDADFAAETANLTRNQILVQGASKVLGVVNSQPQAVLALL
jgi:flagellin